MYAKIFSQIYSSSIAEDYKLRIVFMDMLVLADQNGVVDMTHEAIARFTNVPLDLVTRAISQLEGADPKSRNPKSDGARLVRLDGHREWGWMIVNYEHYRSLASEEQRREKTRERVRKFRASDETTPLLPDVTLCNAGNAKQKQKQKQKQMDKKKSTASTEEEMIAELEKDETYTGIDIRRECGKMNRWCAVNRKQPSYRRFVNWLNRIEKPIAAKAVQRMTAPFALRLGKLFNRPPTEPWDQNEVSLFESLSESLTKEDVETVERFYASSEPRKYRSLGKMLLNWNQTLDWARTNNPKIEYNL